jgi:hypothetical protein
MEMPATTRAVHEVEIVWEPGWREVLFRLDPAEPWQSMSVEEYRRTFGLATQVMHAIDRAARNVIRFPRTKRPARHAARHATAPAD